MSAHIRRYFSSYEQPMEPPEYGLPPPDDGGTPVGTTPVAPTPVDHAARAGFRANRIRDYLNANPNRRAGPMGRNPDGSINWDTSTGIGAAGAAEDARRRAQAQALATGTGQAPRPGTFNGAAPNPAAQISAGATGWTTNTGGNTGTSRVLQVHGGTPYVPPAQPTGWTGSGGAPRGSHGGVPYFIPDPLRNGNGGGGGI